MAHYRYEGAVLVSPYKQPKDGNWIGETFAVSAGRAKTNLIYRYKCEHGLIQKTKITLMSDVVEI